MFPSDLWSVHEHMQNRFPNIQNNIEVGHIEWENLVGNADIGIHRVIDRFQKEQQYTGNSKRAAPHKK